MLKKLTTLKAVTLVCSIDLKGYTKDALDSHITKKLSLYEVPFELEVTDGYYNVTVQAEDLEVTIVALEAFEKEWFEKL